MSRVFALPRAWALFALFTIVTAIVYRPGLNGAYLFDDFPNIVDNPGVKPADASLPSLIRVALSSPSSEFKRPLASLTFGMNYLLTGTNPFWMKATNLFIHLLNGWLAFLTARLILRLLISRRGSVDTRRGDVSAALVAGAWLLLPINLTAVLYVVQRMESLANLFVFAGLLGYIHVRNKMQVDRRRGRSLLAVAILVLSTTLGLLAKETAVMLPMYALVAEIFLFRYRSASADPAGDPTTDRRIQAMFLVVLWIPMLLGLAWILPGLLQPSGWSTRDFVMSTRLLTEARIVLDYVGWTIIPTPEALSFYHDDIVVSHNLLTPWTTLTSIIGIAALAVLIWVTRTRVPIVSLGVSLFIVCHLLTGTILPLELVYEHRNYFASFGLMLALIPLLAQPMLFGPGTYLRTRTTLVGPVAVVALLTLWTGLTAFTSYSWATPLRLARELAERAPASPRAQYELGRTYIILSGYDPDSPFVKLAYDPLERAAALAGSGILPEQALIFLNARMHLPIKDAWWASMEEKLRTNKVTVQDESALGALSSCMQQQLCVLPVQGMMNAYLAALNHTNRSARLLATYADFAWNQLNDRELSIRMSQDAIRVSPRESAYRIGLINKLIVVQRWPEARTERQRLGTMNVAGDLNRDLANIDMRIPAK
jgi:hypothetical protein